MQHSFHQCLSGPGLNPPHRNAALKAQGWVYSLPTRRRRFDPWVGEIPWRRVWRPAPVFLPGESHGQRSLEGYSPWGHKESDTSERTCTGTEQENRFQREACPASMAQTWGVSAALGPQP